MHDDLTVYYIYVHKIETTETELPYLLYTDLFSNSYTPIFSSFLPSGSCMYLVGNKIGIRDLTM